MIIQSRKTTNDEDQSKTSQEIQDLMNKNYAYPDPSDPELQYKTYTKREFYAHKIPDRPDINDYADIKEHRDNICARDFTLHEHQAMISNFINPDTPYRGILMFHGVGVGKCKVDSSWIGINGNIMKIKDIWDKYASDRLIIDKEGGQWCNPRESLIVNSIDNNGKIVKKEVKRLYREKIKCDIKEIELENGYNLGITQVHKLLQYDGWGNNLKVGDFVAIPRKMYNSQDKNKLDVSEELAFLLGWQISEGHERNNSYCTLITNNNLEILNQIKEKLKKISEKYKINFNNPSIKFPKDRVPHLQINSKEYVKFLEKHGYIWGKLSANKKIPDFIMNAPLNCIKIFLKAYFDAEAHMNDKNGIIEITSASEVIIKQLDMLCRMFEINIRIKKKMKMATNGLKIKRPYYSAYISGPSLRLFKEHIGFSIDYKINNLNKSCERKVNTNLDVIPITHKLKEIYENTKLPKRRFIDFSYINHNNGTKFPTITMLKKTIENLEDVLTDEDLLEYYNLDNKEKMDYIRKSIKDLQAEIDREVYWVKIKSVNLVPYDNYVYDLEIDDIHNYVGEGILSHNTCSGIAIAEKFKSVVQKYNTKIYVLVSGPLIKENWKYHILKCTGETYLKYQDKSVYIDEAEKSKIQKNAMNQALQYYRFMSYRSFYKRVLGEKIVEKKVVKGSKVRVSYRKTEEGEFERDIAVDRIYNLNNTIILVDEAHNLTGNAWGEALTYIIKNSVNLRIILMTATPMKNLADDIIPLLNFIRPQNFQIERDKIFDSNKNHLMAFKTAGLEYLKNMARGYISHVRGADPLIFARRIDKGKVPEGLSFVKVIQCRMLPFQRAIYDVAVQNRDDTLDRRSEAVANFVFPGLNQDRKELIGLYGREGILTIKNQLKINHDLINKKIGEDILKLDQEQNDLLYNTEDGKTITGKILQIKNLKFFSIKFYKALKKLGRLIWGKKGPRVAFVYSNLVKVGIELFQQILIQNGYLEYQDKTTYQIAPTTICYFCGKTYKEHQTMTFAENIVSRELKREDRIYIEAPKFDDPESYERLKEIPQESIIELNSYGGANSDDINSDSDNLSNSEVNSEIPNVSASSTDYEGYKRTNKPIPKHQFYPATFISITGKSSEESAEFIPEDKKRMLDNVFNAVENKDGRFIKLVLGSKVMNEGISLRNVAEVHILDVYFNLGKVDQVVGRAIRQCSHYKLMNEDNKFPFVNVYKYVVTIENELSTEEELYKKAEMKYMLIKKVERALKTVAIDCPLNMHGNMFKEEIEQFKDCNEPGKNECPAVCDYQKCDYICDDARLNVELYDPDRKIYKKLSKDRLDYSTFTHGLARDEIEYAKRKIKELYLTKYEYTLKSIVSYVKHSYDEDKRDLFDEFFVFKALDELIPITENDFISFKDTVIDKYNRPGYLIYIGSYYIFQPLDQNEDVPMYYRTTFDKSITQKLSLFNYLKNTVQYQTYKGQKVTGKEKENQIIFSEEITSYNFEKTMDYYENRDEFKYVGIIDKEISRRKNKQSDEIKDVFKIREKRSKTLEKKRGTGIPSFKGAVCSTSKNKEYLENVAKELGAKFNLDETRTNICDKIRDRMLMLEKYEKGNITYIMIPANHPIYPFPYNIYDRLKFIKNQINDAIKFKIDLKVKEKKKTSGPEKGMPSFYITIKDDAKLKEYESFLKKLKAIKEKNEWVIKIE